MRKAFRWIVTALATVAFVVVPAAIASAGGPPALPPL